MAAAPVGLALADELNGIPKYRIVSDQKGTPGLGMPGPFPGRVVSVKSAKVISQPGDKIDSGIVREMMARGICSLTGEKTPEAAWKRFFEPSDIVAIKVNCGGIPHVISSPEVVAECVRNLGLAGIKPTQIYVYERFHDQLRLAHYPKYLPGGVNIFAAETSNKNTERQSYDPGIYADVDFFGEEDTRSNLMNLISKTVTKVINIPTIKDHGATGATGCLKNIAYGSFSNVARSHSNGLTHTYSFVGTLAAIEPLRTKTVLQIMDGIKGVWHGGPFAATRRFMFYPKQILMGTDPVAIDRTLLDIVDAERKAHGAISIWNRSKKTLNSVNHGNWTINPNVNVFIREPGHVAYAGKLGLGVSDLKLIQHTSLVI